MHGLTSFRGNSLRSTYGCCLPGQVAKSFLNAPPWGCVSAKCRGICLPANSQPASHLRATKAGKKKSRFLGVQSAFYVNIVSTKSIGCLPIRRSSPIIPFLASQKSWTTQRELLSYHKSYDILYNKSPRIDTRNAFLETMTSENELTRKQAS